MQSEVDSEKHHKKNGRFKTVLAVRDTELCHSVKSVGMAW